MRGRASGTPERSDEKRCFRETHLPKHKAERALSDRCRIVLQSAGGLTGKQVAANPAHAEHAARKCAVGLQRIKSNDCLYLSSGCFAPCRRALTCIWW